MTRLSEIADAMRSVGSVEQHREIGTAGLGEPDLSWSSGGIDGTLPTILYTGNFVAALTKAMVLLQEWQAFTGKEPSEHPLIAAEAKRKPAPQAKRERTKR